MGFGGPVWHASVSPRYAPVPAVLRRLWEIAEKELQGVGDPTLGEWREVGERAVHLRRRLTPKEQRESVIDAAVDIRGTSEFTDRIRRIRPFLPPQMAAYPDQELP